MAGADILAVGMITPVGANAGQTARSVRAGVARLAESSIHNREFEPMKMALVPEAALPPLAKTLEGTTGLTSRQLRMLRLAGAALNEAVADAAKVSEVPLLLAVPEALPGQAHPAGARFLELLIAQSDVDFELSRSKLFPNGRAGGFHALAGALDLLRSGVAARVLVGGVDSYLDLNLLSTLDLEGRVLAESVMDGFVPGEGAAVLLLGTSGGPNAKPISRLSAVATGTESGHRYSKEPYRGDGLAETIQALFAAAEPSTQPIGTVLAGLNGESFGGKEWGTTYSRNKDRFADDMRLTHPVDCFGDSGAALGPILVALAVVGLGDGTVAGPCLAWASSEHAERGAALMNTATS